MHSRFAALDRIVWIGDFEKRHLCSRAEEGLLEH